MADTLAILADIQATARRIRAETQRVVSYRELHHAPAAGNAVEVQVYLQNEDGTAFWWDGSDHPIHDHQVPLEVMHEQMLAWLVEHRKQEKAA